MQNANATVFETEGELFVIKALQQYNFVAVDEDGQLVAINYSDVVTSEDCLYNAEDEDIAWGFEDDNLEFDVEEC